MAGALKPNVEGLREEANYKVLSLFGSQGSGGTVDNCGLFNGVCPNEWNTPNVFYWQVAGHYIEIEIESDCNIWRSGTTGWSNAISPLTIFKYDVGISNYVDISSSVIQTLSAITENQWEKTITGLPAGRYKFTGGNGVRLDCEWYIEKSIPPILLQVENDFYSINEEYYDSINRKYTPLSTDDLKNDKVYFPISNLLNDITINNETFKPITKFKYFKFVSESECTFAIKGIKSDKELIISNQNLSISSAEQINSFSQNILKTNNGNCKTVFSLDNGLTWKTWDTDTSQFVNLSNTVSNDIEPKNMSGEQKIEWDTFKNEVYIKGIDNNTMPTLNFNTLFNNTNIKIKFAHILIRPSYEDTILLKNISWNINEKGKWRQLSTSDIDIAIDSNSCNITALNNNMKNIKVNILI